jgi:hypothetical protein
MRIFVGTLYTIENEFEACVASIERQTYRDFQHFVFEGLPNKEAHDALYRAFMDRSDEFDLLIKVDADMVIEDQDLFAKIVRKFRANEWLEDLEIAVHDFFSDQLIWGLHTYRNTVRWEQDDEDLFVDACPVDADARLHDDSELAPAAIHCKNPSPFQAFHYGVHKALKTIQPRRLEVKEAYTRYHWNNLERTREHFLETRDKRIGFAVLGAELTFGGGIHPAHLDYSDSYLRNLFDRYQHLDAAGLKQIIKRVSLSRFGFLPSATRLKVLTRVFRWRARFEKLFGN